MFIYLHIGFEKTGSTAIQFFLKNNLTSLESNSNISVYKSLGRDDNRALVTYSKDKIRASEDAYFKKMGLSINSYESTIADDYKEFRKQVKHGNDIVVSSELFSSNLIDVAEIDKLCSLLKVEHDDKVIVVGYLKHQIDMLSSHYTTELKNGRKVSLSSKAERVLSSNDYYYDYFSIVNNWFACQFIEHIKLTAFDELGDFNFDVVKHFCSTVGVDYNDSGLIISRANKSLSMQGQLLLRLLNSINTYNYSEKVSQLRKIVIKEFVGKGENLSPEYVERLSAVFDPMNEKLNSRYSIKVPDFQASQNYTPNQYTVKQVNVIDKVVNLFNKASFIDNSVADDMRAIAFTRDIDDMRAMTVFKLAREIRPNGKLIVSQMSELEGAISAVNGVNK